MEKIMTPKLKTEMNLGRKLRGKYIKSHRRLKKSNEHTGFDITFSEDKLNKVAEPLSTSCSIFQAEAIAI